MKNKHRFKWNPWFYLKNICNDFWGYIRTLSGWTESTAFLKYFFTSLAVTSWCIPTSFQRFSSSHKTLCNEQRSVLMFPCLPSVQSRTWEWKTQHTWWIYVQWICGIHLSNVFMSPASPLSSRTPCIEVEKNTHKEIWVIFEGLSTYFWHTSSTCYTHWCCRVPQAIIVCVLDTFDDKFGIDCDTTQYMKGSYW